MFIRLATDVGIKIYQFSAKISPESVNNSFI